MPLQIRRGTNAERTDSTFTPAEGELIYTTDTKKLYVGDGVTPGGVAIDTVGDDSTISGVGGATTINELSDVIIENPVSGSILKYDGVNWTAGTAKDIISLDDLLDVIIENPAPGGILKYDGINWTVSEDTGGALSLDDLLNVIIENPVPGGILKYDGSNWTVGEDTGGGANTLNDLLDVIIENPVPGGSMLMYDGVNWVASNDDISITGDIFANVVYGDTEGDHFGDVIADDSTTRLVDATLQQFTGSLVGNVTGDVTGNVSGNVTGDVSGNVTGDVSGNVIGGAGSSVTTESVETDFISAPDNSLQFTGTGDINRLVFNRTDTSAIADNVQIARLTFAKTDSTVPTTTTISSLDVTNDQLIYFPQPGGSGNANNYFKLHSNGKMQISVPGAISTEPTAGLEVGGSIKPGVYADATARDAAITAPTAGEMVFVTDVAKFQGYDGSSWVNLN